ncbi:nuclease [Gemmobacter aquarius]|uniref:Nuclease n=1 Tax=Paragemmobacter aquarius TaxID=2169400 RepID=A0A2S0UMQ7_9RHOB|nr:nuclease [Gemmobacter aquarius]
MALIFRSLIVLALIAGSVQAETVSGRARVVDGDTLAIGAEHVRLFGIDAPERDQTCDRGGRPWACGRDATRALNALVGKARLVCEVQDRDRYGRAVSICAAGETDLAEALVEQGAAVAYRRYSLRYVAAETRARARRLGVWSGQMVLPEAYRHGTEAESGGDSGAESGAGAGGCVIKGNVGTHGRIYHLPGQTDYAATRINEARGEAWFCSEADARAAGFRKAQR